MSTFGKIFTTILILALVGGGVWWFVLREDTDEETNTDSSQQSGQDSNQNGDSENAAATIVYTDDGFEPASYEVRSGDTVMVLNQSNDDLQFSSDPHPDHTENSELNTGRTLGNGESATLVLTTVGTWGFHNHHNDAHAGSIIVTD